MAAKDPNNRDKPKKPKVKQRKRSHSTVKKQPVTLSQVAAQKNDPNLQRPSLLLFTLQFLYKNLYILGIQVLRRMRRYNKRVRKAVVVFMGGAHAVLERFFRFVGKGWKRFVQRLLTPFVRISTSAYNLSLSFKERRPLSNRLYNLWRLVWAVIRLFLSILFTILNYLAPIAACWLLVYTINLYREQPLGLEVIYQGEVIGYVQDETVFESATQIMRERFVDDSVASSVSMPQYRLVSVNPESTVFDSWLSQFLFRMDVVTQDFTPAREIANFLIRNAGQEIEHAYGLYIDGQFYGAITDPDFIFDSLQEILDQSRQDLVDSLEENNIRYEDESVEFTRRIAVRDGLYPMESITTNEDIHDVLYQYEAYDDYYEVVEGDSPLIIAEKTGVPYELLLELNPDMEDSLFVGDELLIAMARPFLTVQNTYTIIYREDYPYEVEEIETITYHSSYREVVQDGVDGIREVTAKVTAMNGLETDREIVETKVIVAPIPRRVIVGIDDTPDEPETPPVVPDDSQGTQEPGGTPQPPDKPQEPPPDRGSGFIWPTSGGYATTYANHSGNGVDIARPYGTPIYASRAGTVVSTKVGYTGYGIHLIIDHGDGYSTLYAHCSEMYVSPGQYVEQGQVIAAIGRTGWATGNHVHFEIRYQGSYLYPVNYIGNAG